MNSNNFKGRIAVITGAATGIGFAVAQRLARSGATLALWDMDGNGADDAARRLNTDGGSDALAIQTDITKLADVERAAQQTAERLGPVDILVNSAGIAGANAPICDYPPEEWDKVMQVNLTGTFNVNRTLVRGMIERNYGRVVNIASIAGKEGNPNAGAYSASKAGVIALTKSLGKETATHNIAINAITPAAAKTRIFDQMSDEHIAYMLSKIPRGRFVEVDEIAAMVAWLVSEENSFTTGAVFDLSGGRATY